MLPAWKQMPHCISGDCMDNSQENGFKYEFTAMVYHYSTSKDGVGWAIVSLPKDMAVKIREDFKQMEQGWGRLTATPSKR